MKMKRASGPIAVLAWAMICSASPALAEIVSVRLIGSVSAGSSWYNLFGIPANQSWAGRPAEVKFSYDTALSGNGVFSGSAAFIDPVVTINGVSQALRADLPPDHPPTISLVDAAPDKFSVDYDMTHYFPVQYGSSESVNESLTVDFSGGSNFLNDVLRLPSGIDVPGAGTGLFSYFTESASTLYGGQTTVFGYGANIAFNRLVIGPSSMPGDFNGDLSVSAADYTVWREGLANNTYAPGDYNVWASRFSQTSSSAGAAAVPEPGALVLWSLAVGGLMTARGGLIGRC